jgi:hypothetical protein
MSMIGAKSTPHVNAIHNEDSGWTASDSAMIIWAGVVLLAAFAVMLFALPIDPANGPQDVLSLMGP